VIPAHRERVAMVELEPVALAAPAARLADIAASIAGLLDSGSSHCRGNIA
jgi:hypothetical protein